MATSRRLPLPSPRCLQLANGSGSRQGQRQIFEETVRVALLENDIDLLERKVDAALKAMEEKLSKELGELRSEIKSMRTMLIGLLVSVATGAVMVAINIALQA